MSYYKDLVMKVLEMKLAKIFKYFKNTFLTTNEWIKKMWYTMEFYSATKKNKIWSSAGKWMELENIILSRVSQAERAKNCMFSLICIL
jgi:hypothetical protein